MRIGNVAVAGVVVLGVAGLLAYTHFDQAKKLRAGTFQAYDMTVLSVVGAAGSQHGGLVVMRWTEQPAGEVREGGAYITLDDYKAQKYKPGDSVRAWAHPGMSRPVISAAMPNSSAAETPCARPSGA